MPEKGYNINLGDLRDKYDEAMQSAKESGGKFHLVMTVPNGGVNGAGEIAEVTRWRDALSPAWLLWRTYSTFEGDWVKMLGYGHIDDMWRDNDEQFRAKCKVWADRQAAQWFRERMDNVIHEDPICEPGLDANNKRLNERYVMRCVALIEACNFFGVRVAIGAFSVGTPHEDMIEQGVYDPLLRIVKYLSVHEYPAGLPGAGDLFPYEDLLDPENYWQKLPQSVWETDARYWLERRCDRLYLRAKELGNDVQIIISESNTSEDIPDAMHVNNALKARGLAIAECGGDLRGHQAWQKYYEKVFNDTDFQRNVARILEYQVRYVNNKPYIIGDCTFHLGRGWGKGQEGRYRCHNYLGDDCYDIRHHYIPDINKRVFGHDTQPIPEPEPEPVPDIFDPPLYDANVSFAGTLRIRSGMSTNTDILGVITNTTKQIAMSKVTNPANGYNWFKCLVDDNLFGYFADLDGLQYEFIEDTPDPQPEPEPDDLHARVTELEALAIQQQQTIDTLTAQIAEILAEFETERIDFLQSTVEVAKIVREPVGMVTVALGKVLIANGYRLAGITTTTEIADAVFSTQTAAPDMSQYFSNVAHDDDDSLLIDYLFTT